MKLLITGASGYIGQRLVRLALAQGHQVIGAGRRRGAGQWLAFDLEHAGAFDMPTGVDAVIHLAAVTAASGDEHGQVQLAAAGVLLEAAGRARARLLFVSSQTARQDAPTSYGRTKWQIEQRVLASDGWVVRPGQVYGAAPGGLFGVLLVLVGKLPFIPAFLPAPHIQPIHVDDLAQGMLAIVTRPAVPSGTFHLAAGKPVRFSAFLGAIARQRLRRRRWPLPVPVVAIRLAGLLLGAGLKKATGLDRLESLFGLPVMDTGPDLLRLQLNLRPLDAGMHPSGDDRRRRLLLEAQALLGYLLAGPVAPALRQRYVRMIERVRDGRPLPLPSWLVRWPAGVALWDRCGVTGRHGTELVWRLHAATVLAEASVQGATRFLGIGRRGGMVTATWSIGMAVLGELFWRVASVAFGRAIHRSLRDRAGHER